MPSDATRDDLIAEVTDLRALNQTRRDALQRFQAPSYVARYLARLVLARARRRVRWWLARLARPYLVRRDSRYYHPNFSPYRVLTVSGRAGSVGRPRVLHAIANFTVGGSAQLVVDLIEGLGEVDQRVVTREQPRIPAYTGLVISDYPHLTSSRPVQALLKQFQPDIVHVHYLADHKRTWSDADYGWYMHVFDATRNAGIKVIENVNIPTEPFLGPRVDRYVFVSNYIRRRYASSEGAATVIYPGSDLERFRRPPGFTLADQTVGLVYRLQPDKLDATSLDPLVHVLRDRSAANAIVVGGGQHFDGYKRTVAAAGISNRVTFTGYVGYSELPKWYSRMSVFVAPVHNESFGQVSVFAMGMELPVAGYRVGALEEILGDASLLASPGDAEELSAIILGLLDDPIRSQEIGRRNRRRAEERFALPAMIARYRSLYEDLLGSG